MMKKNNIFHEMNRSRDFPNSVHVIKINSLKTWASIHISVLSKAIVAHLKNVVAHLEMWQLIWRCGCSSGDVVALLEMGQLFFRCCSSSGDVVAHLEMWQLIWSCSSSSVDVVFWRCGSSSGVVVALLQMLQLFWRCGSSSGDVVAKWLYASQFVTYSWVLASLLHLFVYNYNKFLCQCCRSKECLTRVNSCTLYNTNLMLNFNFKNLVFLNSSLLEYKV